MLVLLLFVAAAFPLAWLLSEAQRHRWISVVLGCASLVIVAFLAQDWGTFRSTIDLNVTFGDASKTLLTAVVQELDDGKVESVKQELNRFIDRYDPNYQNNPRYDEMVEKTVNRLRQGE